MGGTILAYFFARENFEAASRSMNQLVQTVQRQATALEKLKAIPVIQAMVPLNLMIVNDNQSDTLSNALRLLDDKGIKRLPILDKTDRPIALTYKEHILDFLYRVNVGKTEAEKESLTVQNLLEASKYKREYALVSEQANLSDAKCEMDKIRNCRDIFVTKTGTPNEPVVGLLIDTDILKYAQM